MENLHKETSTSNRTGLAIDRSRVNIAFRPISLVLLSLIIASSMAVFPSQQPAKANGDPPTVNGLFYGDGDDAKYQLYSTSENGSGLYTYYDAPSRRLYVALLVSQDVNDTVCGPKAYTVSAGWNQARSCKRLTDSEFASFTFECGPGSQTNSWEWQQAFACAVNTADPPSIWQSDPTCGASLGIWPPGIVASTSWVSNANDYQTLYPYSTPWPPAPPPPWDMYRNGIILDNWISPYVVDDATGSLTVPPLDMGYPTYSSYDQWDSSYSSVHGWEWSMVYEWSVDLGPDGANCGNEMIYVITGLSHHSPGKNGEEDDPFTPPDDPIFSDWGDLPDSYGTTSASSGARHFLTASGPFLGQDVQAELDGQPTTDATGDGPEEDGIAFNVGQAWTPGTTVQIDVTVSGNNGYLVGWFDWNLDGSFSVDEMYDFGSLDAGVYSFNVTVPMTASNQGFFYMRFRLYDSTNLPAISPTGDATGGEVEDYYHAWNPLAVGLTSFTAQAQDQAILLEWATANELDTIGFHLYRAESPLGWQIQLNSELIASHGLQSLVGDLYTHLDDTAVPGITYYYWLEEVNTQGLVSRSGPVSAVIPASEMAPYRLFLPIVGK